MRLYVMRHGETDWNAVKKIQGQADIPLNQKGIDLAKKTGEALERVPFDLVISSPLIRAMQTAECVVRDRKIPILTDPRIMEINFGEMEGAQSSSDTKPEYARRLWNFFHDPAHYEAPEGGESIPQICQRTGEFWDELISCKEYQDKTILITLHGCAMRALLQSMYGKNEDFWHGKVPPNCCVNIIDVTDGHATFLEEDKVFY